ncbi:hypothetical protein SLS62_005729 [Diatrype stigma]|uniref:Nicotinamide-nucleotide adenylyltransferase n=1 Tax=Diatrype stigma TaxID=117547 RepID=A0AAN9YPK4_9PEZI
MFRGRVQINKPKISQIQQGSSIYLSVASRLTRSCSALVMSAPNPNPPVSGAGAGAGNGEGLPENLLAFFTQGLESYQLSNTTFRVLCSLSPTTSSPSSSSSNELLLAPPAPPTSHPRRLLVLDSSFNPPTLAHLRMALSAAAETAEATVPAKSPPPSPSQPQPQSQRVLLLLATSNADKAPKPAAFPQRLAMMYIFAQDLLSAMAAPQSAEEAVQSGPASTAVDIAVTTEPYFHSKSRAIAESDFYQQSTAAAATATFEQVYLTGFDTLIRIFNPKYYPGTGTGTGGSAMAAALDPFFARSRLRVTMRTDADWGDAEAQRKYVDGLRGHGDGDGGLVGVGWRAEWAEKVEMVEAGRRVGEEAAIVSSTKVRDAVVSRDWSLLRTLVSERMIEWIRREGLYS